MAKAIQYSSDNGSSFSQLPDGGLSNDDILLTNVTANRFISVKDSNDNLYILCTSANDGTSVTKAKIIKIESDGTKSIATLNWDYSGYVAPNARMFLHRDETKCTVCNIRAGSAPMTSFWEISLDFVDGALISEPSSFNGTDIAIYQDIYIWNVTGLYIELLDYTSKTRIGDAYNPVLTGTGGNGGFATSFSIFCDVNNDLYILGQFGTNSINGIVKVSYNGGISGTVMFSTNVVNTGLSDFQQNYEKQIVIDKWNDLIILTNSGSNSTLLKYTTTGTLIENFDLNGVYNNLNTDHIGNYYYSNATSYWKINNNTSQGQVFNTPAKIRNTGSTTYGNNDTGYYPSVQAL